MSQDFNEIGFVPSSNWNMEDGYTKLKNLDTESYPFRVFGTGDPSGLTVLFRVSKPDIDHLCGGTIQGFKIKFHNPSEDPQIWKKRYQLSPDAQKLFIINPAGTAAKDEIRKYDAGVRNCYYPFERPLRYYKRYSQRNCETECLANYTLVQCGCVKFSMPSEYRTIFNRISLQHITEVYPHHRIQ